MAEHSVLAGHWLIRNITWIAIAAAIGSGSLMLAFDLPLALGFPPAFGVTLVAWFVGKASLKGSLQAPVRSPDDGAVPFTTSAEQAPEKTASLPLDLVAGFPLPLIITEGSEIVVSASHTARQLFPALSAGRPISLALRNPDLLDALVATRKDGTARSIILDDSTVEGRVMRVHLVAMAGPHGVSKTKPVIGCVFEDLTEQRATERMRVDFIANASHELRTPLASLLGFIETLQGPARDDTEARTRFLAIMREQATRMARLIDDLLSLSRAEQRAHQQPVEVIDLRIIVREIVELLDHSASERGVALSAELPDEPMNIRGDRDDLLRLVENLVENGIRYGRAGKRVEIAFAPGPDGERVLSVRDHGPGIAARHIPRLTERFYRADVSQSRENGGTGLGLAIVKHLVARHRARLEIDSRVGEGATFRVVFPPSGP
jgi:two-component system, OmpR family, phosphate regulon sensor histidine kinase PhoR